MENDIKKRQRNALLGKSEPKEPIRARLVMSLVYMIRVIEKFKVTSDREVLRNYFYDIVKELKLTDREKQLFEFEYNNISI